MLISKELWYGVVVFAGLVAAVGGIGLFASIQAGNPRRQRIILGAIGAVGLAALVFAWAGSSNALVCTDRNGTVHVERMMALGAPGDGTRIINRSSHTLRIEVVQYSVVGIGLPIEPKRIPPGSELRIAQRIDLIGPRDQPPPSIQSADLAESRRWLTWGGD